jgi:uncharacterized protein
MSVMTGFFSTGRATPNNRQCQWLAASRQRATIKLASAAGRTKSSPIRSKPDSIPHMIRDSSSGVELDVRVIPRARKTEMAGTRDDAILVRLAAPPVEGAANEALIAFIAEWLGVPRRAVQIVAGDRSRRKRVAVAGLSAELIRARLRV